MKLYGMKRRGGFTMVELIFVVIFLSILAALAIPRISGGTESAILASMKNDARTAISAENNYYSEYQDYADGTVTGGEKEGAKAKLGTSNVEIVASPNNTVTLTAKDCGDGTKGFDLLVSSTKSDKTVTFDSCNGTSIAVKEPSS